MMTTDKMKKLSDYEVISVIGSGSFGTCFKVKHKETDDVFVWKALNYDEFSESKKESLLSEINLLRQLKHPNIVEYFDHIVNKETKTLYIIMECCEGGDLLKLIQKCKSDHMQFEEAFVWRILYQTCKALQMCHNKMDNKTVLHRDIKPANIFLDGNGNVKLGDFGLARILRHYEKFADSMVGTPYYMSPEIVMGDKYNKTSDVWALGCLIYEVCMLRPPFRGNHFQQLSENITKGHFHPIPENYSKELQKIIEFMLNPDYDARPTIEVILRHPDVVRNVSNIEYSFPKLVPSVIPKIGLKLNFDSLSETVNEPVLKSNFSLYSTPILKSEVFGTIQRNFLKKHRSTSDPDLSKFKDSGVSQTKSLTENYDLGQDDPNLITQNIFDEVLKKRLQDIRIHESILRQKEADLKRKEDELNKRSQNLTAMEKIIEEKQKKLDMAAKKVSSHIRRNRRIRSVALQRVENYHEDTYCSIEPNDATMVPTVAKMNLDLFQQSHLTKKVTFQSPKKLVKYNIENVAPDLPPRGNKKVASKCILPKNKEETFLRSLIAKSSSSSKKSDESDENHNKRRSFFSIFVKQTQKLTEQIEPHVNDDSKYVMKLDHNDLANKWTAENKKAAFELLAAMNTNGIARRSSEDCNQQTFHRSAHRRTIIASKRESGQIIL